MRVRNDLDEFKACVVSRFGCSQLGLGSIGFCDKWPYYHVTRLRDRTDRTKWGDHERRGES